MPIEKAIQSLAVGILFSTRERGRPIVEKDRQHPQAPTRLSCGRTAHNHRQSTRSSSAAYFHRCETSLRTTGWSNCQHLRTEKETNFAGTLKPLMGTHDPIGISLSQAICVHFVHQINQGIQEPRSAEFLFAAGPRTRLYERVFYHIGLAKYETAIQQGGLASGCSEGNTGRQAVYFTLVNYMDQNPNQNYEAYKHMKPHHDAIYVGHGGRTCGEFQVQPHAQPLRYLLQHHLQEVH